MGADLAYNPFAWAGLVIALIFMVIGIIYSHKVKQAKIAAMEKKLDELDKRRNQNNEGDKKN